MNAEAEQRKKEKQKDKLGTGPNQKGEKMNERNDDRTVKQINKQGDNKEMDKQISHELHDSIISLPFVAHSN